MKKPLIQVTTYLTPAPPSEDVFYEVEVLQEVERVCEKLYRERWPQAPYDEDGVHQHFADLVAVMNLAQHLAIQLEEGLLDVSALLRELSILLPQFVWLTVGCQGMENGARCYTLDFIPLAYREEGFPFDLQVTESIVQQLCYEPAEALDALCQEISQLIVDKRIWRKGDTPTNEWVEETEAPMVPLQQLRRMEEEAKREKYAKERMRIANEKLELMMEQLELAMMYGGMNHFDNVGELEQDEDWDKKVRISLREYSYLMKKAKYLEQVWQINGQLVRKTETMTVSNEQVTYQRDQVQQVKDHVTSGEIYLVLDECQEIAGRAQVKNRPWFRKPYVKLMRMDYDSLLKKAAYFDLLQGESYLLERKVLVGKA